MRLRPDFVWPFLLGALLASPGRAEEPEGREFLLFQEIRSVYTASKADESIERATAVVTVVTAEEIRRWGTRTLYEVLKRVPGFFPSSQATWTLTGSRGLTSDGNDHILLLVDGHVQNSIVGQGYQQQDMLPVLEKVKKIEILRGPGSVLWGSSAVLGIINIITRDEAGEGSRVSVAYGARDGMLSANILRSLGGSPDGTTGVVSASYWQSQGYNRPGKSAAGSSFSSGDAETIHANVEFPWGRVSDWPALDRHKAGWEVYSRIKIGPDREVLARLAESRVVYPWDTWLGNPGSELRMRKTYLVYRQHDQLGEHVSLESSVYGDMLLQNRFPVASQLFHAGGGNNRVKMQDQSNEEEALGGEVSGQVRLAENNRATVGLKVVHAIIGPNRDARFDIAANTPTAPDSSDSTVYPYVGVQSGTDNTIAGYFEDTWDLNARKTTLFAGARVEYNDFREKRTLVLPRGGVVHSLTGRSTVKYVFNTGYLRPNAVYSKTTGIIVDEIRGPSQGILLVDKSEQILNHEVQWYWRGDRGFLAANAFYMSIANYISFDASHTPQGYKNLGDARSRGVEVEGRWQAGDAWDLYANYSFVHADLHETRHQGALTDQHNETLNYPSHLGNLGVNWCDGDQDGDGDGERTINVNLNGWRSMPYVKPLSGDGSGGTFSSLAGEAYLDVDFHQARLFGTSVDLSVFCTNVLDNTHRVGMIVNNGVWYPRGRNAGASLEYRW